MMLTKFRCSFQRWMIKIGNSKSGKNMKQCLGKLSDILYVCIWIHRLYVVVQFYILNIVKNSVGEKDSL